MRRRSVVLCIVAVVVAVAVGVATAPHASGRSLGGSVTLVTPPDNFLFHVWKSPLEVDFTVVFRFEWEVSDDVCGAGGVYQSSLHFGDAVEFGNQNPANNGDSSSGYADVPLAGIGYTYARSWFVDYTCRTAAAPYQHSSGTSAVRVYRVADDGELTKNRPSKCPGAVVTFLQGDATADGQPLALNTNLAQSAFVKTGSRTRLELRLPDHSVLRIGPNSTVDLGTSVCRSAEDRKVSARLVVGTWWSALAHLVGGDARFELATENACACVRGTTFEARYDPARKTTYVHAIHHSVYTYNRTRPSQVVTVRPGFCNKIVGGARPTRPARCKALQSS